VQARTSSPPTKPRRDELVRDHVRSQPDAPLDHDQERNDEQKADVNGDIVEEVNDTSASRGRASATASNGSQDTAAAKNARRLIRGEPSRMSPSRD
jgi:hypothetical protein